MLKKVALSVGMLVALVGSLQLFTTLSSMGTAGSGLTRSHITKTVAAARMAHAVAVR